MNLETKKEIANLRAELAHAKKRADTAEKVISYIANRKIEPVCRDSIPDRQWHRHIRYRHLHEYAQKAAEGL